MTALLDVACHLPGTSVPIESVGGPEHHHQMRIFRRYFGLDRVHRAPDRTLFQLHAAAAGKLTELRGREHRVRYVVLARSLSTHGVTSEQPPEQLCRELGLPNAVAFTVTQHACAVGLLAVHLVGDLLTADDDPDALGLVLAGQHPTTSGIQLVPHSTVLGAATAAVLVAPDGTRDRLLSYVAHTGGGYAESIPPMPVEQGFLEEHQEALKATIEEAAEAAGVRLSDLTLILPHNVNTVVWRKLCEDHGLGVDQRRILLDNVPVTGHCFSADSYINHVTARQRGLLSPGDPYLMVGVGLGATYAAAVFRH
ncbi:3-oxoacyl-[acyl-carrier-protein] synthase III C-terminal domain-containing protein [Streptomyces tauricus]|uniref:3-oxoacyl-[acyl-carrier-protein] synthase III C-terminal domain-containing protein n=1 Tax=Streptomyces tauricus TaxID=68274 RepID=UPI0033A6601F